jgi:(p)ppGpp synthase/HD superfamily hydrolase
MILTERFERALVFAARKHAGQTRKGSDVPYITHPVAVALLVHAHGGSEDQVVAALLHDTVEDCGGLPVLEEVRDVFGTTVAQIVEVMTDSVDREREPWRARKQRALDTLSAASATARLVAVCDKLHNVRSILADYETEGAKIWVRFNGGKEGSLWYYRTLLQVLGRPPVLPAFAELERAILRLEALAAGED